MAGVLPVSDNGGSLTVDGPLTDTQLRASAVPVSGTFYQATQPVSAASLPLPSGAAQDGTDITSPSPAMPAGGAGIRGWLSAIWTKLNGSIAVTGTFWQATQPVSGTVTANAGTGTLAVSAASLPLPSGAATNAQITTSVGAQADAEASGDGSVIALLKRLRSLLAGGLPAALGAGGGLKVDGSGTALPISGTITANAGTGTLAVSGPLTDAQLRATAVPVSGTVTANAGTGTMAVSGPVTDTQLRASAVPVTGSGTAGTPAAGVQTVQGITGGTALPTNPNASQQLTYLVGTAVSTGALTGGTAKAVLSLHHAGTAAKTVKIRAIDVALVATTATAGNVTATINRGTAATSAGSTVTPVPSNPADAAAEVTATTNPTITAATTVVQYGFGNLPASGSIAKVRVYEWQPGAEQKPLTLRAGNLDALVLTLTSSAAQTITPYITVSFTEE